LHLIFNYGSQGLDFYARNVPHHYYYAIHPAEWSNKLDNAALHRLSWLLVVQGVYVKSEKDLGLGLRDPVRLVMDFLSYAKIACVAKKKYK